MSWNKFKVFALSNCYDHFWQGGQKTHPKKSGPEKPIGIVLRMKLAQTAKFLQDSPLKYKLKHLILWEVDSGILSK